MNVVSNSREAQSLNHNKGGRCREMMDILSDMESNFLHLVTRLSPTLTSPLTTHLLEFSGSRAQTPPPQFSPFSQVNQHTAFQISNLCRAFSQTPCDG